MSTAAWVVIAIVGTLAGIGAGFWLGRRGAKGSTARLAEVEDELSAYREKVTEHFSQSAAHFQSIGRQYRELYEHMAAGSETLCVPEDSSGQHQFPRPDEVVITRSETESAAGGDAGIEGDDAKPTGSSADIQADAETETPSTGAADAVDSDATGDEASSGSISKETVVANEASEERTVEAAMQPASSGICRGSIAKRRNLRRRIRGSPGEPPVPLTASSVT